MSTESNAFVSPEAANFDEAKQRRRNLIEKLQAGDKEQRRIARKLSRCKKGNRCGSAKCPVCQFQSRRALEARMCAIAENLHRADLTTLEHAELVAKWLQLAARKAETSGQVVGKGGRPRGSIAEAARKVPMPGKTDEARRKAVGRDRKIAGISNEGKEAARAARLDDNATALLAIAKEPSPEAQAKKAKELGKRGRRSIKPLTESELPQLKALKRAFRRATKFKEAWENASDAVRKIFVKKVIAASAFDAAPTSST
jgi:hypothetical protein